jgi:hypothetical protein
MRAYLVGLAGLALLWSAGAAAQNLVENNGFEDGMRGWAGGEDVDDRPRSGRACLRVVDADPAGSVDAHTQALLPVQPGQAYRLRVWVRVPRAGQDLLVTLNQHRADQTWIWGANLDFRVRAGVDWSEFSLVLRAFHPEAAQVRLVLRPVLWTEGGELEGEAWFDDVFFGPEEDPQAALQGAWLDWPAPLRAWVSPVEQKVRRDELLPQAAPRAGELRLAAARGEWEPVQLVLLPEADDVLAGWQVSELLGPAGARIPASRWQAREVAYVEVRLATDHASRLGWTPDPLPALQPPLELRAGVQQPVWLTLHVPEDAPPGDYLGSLRLELGSGLVREVPLAARVWRFALPRARHQRTAYGLWMHDLDRYHHLGGDPTLRREVLRLYLQDFAAHRVSPYDPFGDDRFAITFPNLNWPLGWVVPDPEDPVGPERVLEVRDERLDSNVAAQSQASIPIQPGTSYRLAWRARTSGAHDYLVALNQQDAQGQWLPGRNIDLVRLGDGTWLGETADIPAGQLDPAAASLRLSLFARRWTPAGELVGTTWFDDLSLRAAGGGPELVQNGDLQRTAAEAEPAGDFTRFDAAGEYALDELGQDAFSLPLPWFASGSFQSQWLPELLGFAWGTPEYEALMVRVLGLLRDHLAARGWLERAYVYWFDEPEPNDYPLVRQGMELLARGAPDLRRLLTEQAEPALLGLVDIWAPLMDWFDEGWAGERQAAGDEVWWYVCTGPRAPYPNNFIDHPGIEHRVRFWMAWAAGVQGDLYWATNYWTCDGCFPPPDLQDPWTDPMSYNFDQGVVGAWGNGDGRLLYPPRGWRDGQTRVEGPTPSLRWELIREGLEDHEYLWLLREASDRLAAEQGETPLVARARGLLELPSSLFSSRTAFSDDPGVLQAHRRAVAEALEDVLDALDATQPDGGDGGADPGVDGGQAGDGGAEPGAEGGCGCAQAGGLTGSAWLWLLGLGLRRRRRAH